METLGEAINRECKSLTDWITESRLHPRNEAQVMQAYRKAADIVSTFGPKTSDQLIEWLIDDRTLLCEWVVSTEPRGVYHILKGVTATRLRQALYATVYKWISKGGGLWP